MKATTSFFVAILLVAGLGAGLRLASRNDAASERQAGVPAVPYHLTVGEPAAAGPANRPLPPPQDADSAARMAEAAAAMVSAAEGLEETAPALIATGDPALVALGELWLADARVLRARAAWLVSTATSDAMVHDPARAHELNLDNLRANGKAMAAEGRSLSELGRELAARVEELSRHGTIAGAVAGDLTARAAALLAAGERLERDGERMQDYAKDLLRSLGR
jgi:hypothetical protein